jgi:hypothetical protein
VASVLPPLFFLSEAFYPFIFNFMFPYSYAATLGSFLGLVCLYFTIRHATGTRVLHLGLAALVGGLALLTKQEFGFACLVLLAFDLTVCYLMRRSPRELGRNILAVFAGLSPALAGYGWFTWKLSWKLIYVDNWISTPGTYFMRTFGQHTMAGNGFRFVPHEMISSAQMAALSMALWFAIAYANAKAIETRSSRLRFSILVWTLDVLILFVLRVQSVLGFLLAFLQPMILPKGLFFLGIVFSAAALWKLRKFPAPGFAIQDAALGIYATVAGIRVMMELWPTPANYAVFFNVPVFLVFIVMVTRVIRYASRSLTPSRRNLLTGSMLIVEAALLLAAFLPNPRSLPAPLDTGIGTFYTRADVSILFPQIVSFMRTHTKNGKDILVLPEPPSLYVFAGTQAPTRWYSLLPGMVAPGQEQEYIDEAVSNNVRYILISNRTIPEYGVAPFGSGYDQAIYKWITANFKKVGRFGPLAEGYPDPYVVSIFERIDPRLAP